MYWIGCCIYTYSIKLSEKTVTALLCRATGLYFRNQMDYKNHPIIAHIPSQIRDYDDDKDDDDCYDGDDDDEVEKEDADDNKGDNDNVMIMIQVKALPARVGLLLVSAGNP